MTRRTSSNLMKRARKVRAGKMAPRKMRTGRIAGLGGPILEFSPKNAAHIERWRDYSQLDLCM